MPIETWRPPADPSVRPGDWAGGLAAAMRAPKAPPSGQGWVLSGYSTRPIPTARGIVQTKTPIYIRQTPDPTPAPAPASASKPAPAPAPAPKPEPKLNTARIEAAQKAAAPYLTAYSSAKRPSYDTSLDAYSAPARYGVDANNLFEKLIAANDATARVQGEEMGAALDYQTRRLSDELKLPSLANWRDYYEPLRNDILKA